MPFFKNTTADTVTASTPSSSSLERNQKHKLLGEKRDSLKLLEGCQEFQVEELMGLLGSFDSSAEEVYDIGSLEKALELAKVMYEMDQLRTSTRILDQTIEKLQDESFLNKVKVKMFEEIFKKLAYDLNKWDPDLAWVSLSLKEPKSKDQTCSTTLEESNSNIEFPKKTKKSKRNFSEEKPQRYIGRTWSNRSIKDDGDQESVSSEDNDDKDYGYGKAVPDAALEYEQQQQAPPQPDVCGDATPDIPHGSCFELEGDSPSSQTSTNKPTRRRSSFPDVRSHRAISTRRRERTSSSPLRMRRNAIVDTSKAVGKGRGNTIVGAAKSVGKGTGKVIKAVSKGFKPVRGRSKHVLSEFGGVASQGGSDDNASYGEDGFYLEDDLLCTSGQELDCRGHTIVGFGKDSGDGIKIVRNNFQLDSVPNCLGSRSA